MKELFILLAMALSAHAYAQTNFEPGYFITDKGERKVCLIKNEDWRNTPSSFDYKTSTTTQVKQASVAEVSEFAIGQTLKYVSATVKMDRSGSSFNNLSEEKAPQFEEETLFLKVLVEGDASLYSYSEGELQRFFFRIDKPEPQQLIYNYYRVGADRARENLAFRQQMRNAFQGCSNVSFKEIDRADYRTKDLVELFVGYNECQNADYVNYLAMKPTAQEREAFRITPRVGLSSSAIEVDFQGLAANNRDTDFGNQLSLRLGLELEYILPFRNSKWSIILEPNYQYYNATAELEIFEAQFDYSTLQLPLGIRHYSFLSESSSLFVNLAFIYRFNLDTDLVYIRDITGARLVESEPEPGYNLVIGAGYRYNDKISIEARYQLGQSLFDTDQEYDFTHSVASLIVGYRLF